MELDLSSLWSWTLPLWGLFAVVFLLGGMLTAPAIFVEQSGKAALDITGIFGPPLATGGARRKLR